MTDAACSRAWQAEAIEDGRLFGADRDSFERHAETCSECAREQQELARLRDTVSELPSLSSTALERRRLRSRILERADADGLAEPRSRRRRALAIAAFATAATAVAAALLLRPAPLLPRAPVSAVATGPAPALEMDASIDSRWQKEEEGKTIRYRLMHGQLAFHVAKLEAGQRFIVQLPDGEIEVKGTRFVVEVDDEGTHSVHCSEGRVALRIKGRVVLLLAGDDWSRPALSEAPAGSASPALPLIVKLPEPARHSATDAAPSAGEDFVAAMTAFSDGDLGRAEKLFLAFEQHHPADARVEDTTYLRAVARARRGDREGARELAREYVRRYPNGLRRVEAERLAAESR